MRDIDGGGHWRDRHYTITASLEKLEDTIKGQNVRTKDNQKIWKSIHKPKINNFFKKKLTKAWHDFEPFSE